MQICFYVCGLEAGFRASVNRHELFNQLMMFSFLGKAIDLNHIQMDVRRSFCELLGVVLGVYRVENGCYD